MNEDSRALDLLGELAGARFDPGVRPNLVDYSLRQRFHPPASPTSELDHRTSY